MPDGCVFCAIASGRTPARIVYETDRVLCFFPRRPNLLGHTLIVSREHYHHLGDCPAALGSDLTAAAQRLAEHYAGALGSTGFNLLNASGRDADQSVQHLHLHFFPRRPGDGLDTWPRLPPFDTDLDALCARLRIPT